MRTQRLVEIHHLFVVDRRQFGCAQEVLGQLWVAALLGNDGLVGKCRRIHPEVGQLEFPVDGGLHREPFLGHARSTVMGSSPGSQASRSSATRATARA